MGSEMCIRDSKKTDFIPYQIEFSPKARQRMAEYLNDANFEQKWDAQHIRLCMYEGMARPVPKRPGFFRDDYGVVWDRTGEDKILGTMEKLCIPDMQAVSYSFPSFNKARMAKVYDEFFRTLGDHYPIAGIGLAVYERAWTLAGIKPLLHAMSAYPQQTERLFQSICQNALEIIDFALTYDFDGFFVGDDWTCPTGLEMGGDHWRRYIKPVLREIYARVHTHGKKVFQHSCGDISEILPDLVEIGLDCYQTLQPECYDLAAVKQRYGNSLAFWGGISTKQYLRTETPAQAREEARQAMTILGADGGYIAAPSHVLTEEISPENILEVLAAFKEQQQHF